MGILIKSGNDRDAFDEVEKMMKYRYDDREREQSNHAAALAARAMGTKRLCPLRHQRIAWSGPPHDAVRAYICLECNAAACEPEIKSRGFDFDTIPDWEIDIILDLDLQRQAKGSFVSYPGIVKP